MNIRLRKIQGDGQFIEDYIKRRAEEHNIADKCKVFKRGTTTRIEISGDYSFNLDEEFRHPGFLRDSRIESILDFLDEDFDDDSDNSDE